MSATLSGVTPDYVAASGGDLLVVSGQFNTGVTYRVTLAGVACQSGIAGQGTSVLSIDGATLTAYAPILSPGQVADLQVTDTAGNTATLPAAVRTEQPFYSSEVFSLRSILPPLYDLGPRSFADLPQVNA